MEIADILGALNTIYGVLGTTVTLKDSYESHADIDEKKLEQLVANMNFSNVPEEEMESVKRYCRQFQTKISSGSLFSDSDKEEFCAYYFKQNPSALFDKDEIKKSLCLFLEWLDYYLRKNMTPGEQVIIQKLTEQEKLLSSALTPTPPPEPSIHTANQTYTNAFQEILFLHNKDKDRETVKDVTLANLYVKPRYQGVGFPSRNLSARLQRFVAEDKQHFLLIEGNAGTGKTTLVEWLNYHNWKQTPEVMNLLNDRPLVTIRLRDMKYETLKGGLLSAIQIYLGGGTPLPEKRFTTLLKTALFVLDGFDELCTIEKEDYNKLLTKFTRFVARFSSKIIVTSRPNYIRPLPAGWRRLALLPFDQKQREEWLDNYKIKCKQAVAPHIETYIRSLSKEEEKKNSIFTAPLTLYMVAAKAPNEAELNNEWRLYHAIFYKEIRDTRYNQTTKRQLNTKKVHPAKKYWDIFYQINEEIAYRMYQTGNSRLYVNSDEVKGIIKELSERSPELKEQTKDSTTQAIVQRCHALCGYWKLNSDQGFLEFYHNDIRDFFLCEKLFRAVNDLYHAKNWETRANAVKLVELFQYAELEERVLNFVRQRSSLSKPAGNTSCPSFCEKDFPKLEYARKKEEKRFPAMFQELMTDGKLFFEVESTREDCPGLRTRNPLKSVEITTSSMMNVYNRALVPLLFEKEYLPLFVDIPSVNENGLWKGLMKDIIYWYIERTDLSGVDLSGAELSGADLSGADLRRADLHHAELNFADLRDAILSDVDLRGADLSDAELSGADLRRADLHHAELSCADLRCADLSDADLSDADLSDAALHGASLNDANLRGANLRDAGLCHANLYGADLRGTDLRDAVLSGATLPDGFRSLNEEEQIEHLKSLNIKGLIL